MAILIGTGLVYKEIEKRTIFTLISKPIRRRNSFWGNSPASFLTLAVMVGAMTAVFLFVVFLHTGAFESRLSAGRLFSSSWSSSC
jgi:ABC-type transport system involved in multi-copper enzyme maturation permease subunit